MTYYSGSEFPSDPSPKNNKNSVKQHPQTGKILIPDNPTPCRCYSFFTRFGCSDHKQTQICPPSGLVRMTPKDPPAKWQISSNRKTQSHGSQWDSRATEGRDMLLYPVPDLSSQYLISVLHWLQKCWVSIYRQIVKPVTEQQRRFVKPA